MIGTPWNNVVMMKVIDSSAIEDTEGRWLYTVQPVKFGSSQKFIPFVSTVVPPKEYKAINLWEYNNTLTESMGILIADLPGSYELKRIPDGSIVPAFMANGLESDSNATGGTMVMILWPNQFDGDC